MRIIPPIINNVRFSNVTESIYPNWFGATSYVVGDTVNSDKSYYRALTNNTNKLPRDNPLDWVKISANNRYKVFDKIIGDPAVQALNMVYEMEHNGEIVSDVVLFNVVAETVRVEVIDPVDGLVYDETKILIDNSEVTDWFPYFFAPFGTSTTEVVFSGIPPYGTAYTRITADTPSGDVSIGEIVLGRATSTLGVTVYGSSISIEDYSRKDRDAFGNPLIVQRAFAQLADLQVAVVTSDARRVQKVLAGYRATPVVWIGDEDPKFGTIIFGYFRRFDIVLSSPEISDATIEVEGLV